MKIITRLLLVLHQGGLCDRCCLYRSFCRSVSRITANNNQLISLKLGVVIGSSNRKNWWTFGGDPVPDTDSESLVHLLYHCRIGDFRRFISMSHTVTGRFSQLTPTT